MHYMNRMAAILICCASLWGSAAAAAQIQSPQAIGQARAVHIDIYPAAAGQVSETEVRGAPGASFLKIHFDYFNL
jgi:predicted amidohydrolase